jgi:hypothetical protein
VSKRRIAWANDADFDWKKTKKTCRAPKKSKPISLGRRERSYIHWKLWKGAEQWGAFPFAEPSIQLEWEFQTETETKSHFTEQVVHDIYTMVQEKVSQTMANEMRSLINNECTGQKNMADRTRQRRNVNQNTRFQDWNGHFRSVCCTRSDAANQNSNQKNLDTSKSSILCAKIKEYSSTEEIMSADCLDAVETAIEGTKRSNKTATCWTERTCPIAADNEKWKSTCNALCTTQHSHHRRLSEIKPAVGVSPDSWTKRKPCRVEQTKEDLMEQKRKPRKHAVRQREYMPLAPKGGHAGQRSHRQDETRQGGTRLPKISDPIKGEETNCDVENGSSPKSSTQSKAKKPTLTLKMAGQFAIS